MELSRKETPYYTVAARGSKLRSRTASGGHIEMLHRGLDEVSDQRAQKTVIRITLCCLRLKGVMQISATGNPFQFGLRSFLPPFLRQRRPPRHAPHHYSMGPVPGADRGALPYGLPLGHSSRWPPVSTPASAGTTLSPHLSLTPTLRRGAPAAGSRWARLLAWGALHGAETFSVTVLACVKSRR
jgi:hypothetical protein